MATISRIGCTVPTSLFAHMTVTRATDSGSASIAARTVSGRTRPSCVDRQPDRLGAVVAGQPLDAIEHGVVLDGAGQDAHAARIGVVPRPEQALDGQIVGLGAA